jgi:hypothetical protein
MFPQMKVANYMSNCTLEFVLNFIIFHDICEMKYNTLKLWDFNVLFFLTIATLN